MTYSIAIPSYGRANTIISKTISTLLNGGIEAKTITIFVVESELEAYTAAIGDLDVAVVVGSMGIREQRHFIRQYYPEGTHVVSVDDDIEEIKLYLTDFKDTHHFFMAAFDDLVASNTFLFGVYPVNNQFFQKQRPHSVKRGLSFIIGCLYGFINRHDADLDITVSSGEKEDIELSLRTFIKDGSLARWEHIAVKTKFYSKVGGLGNGVERIERNNTNAIALCSAFPFYCKMCTRKDGRNEIKLTKLLSRGVNDMVRLLPAVDESLFYGLLKMLSNVSLPWHASADYKTSTGKRGNARRGFPKHKAATIGIVKARGSQIIGKSAFSKKNTAIHDEVFRIGSLICPFEFNAVQLNHNVVCPPHVDSNNASDSVLVSFGNYSGGKIVINDIEYSAYCQPITFDGTKLIHWNTPLDEGSEKYSLVFYCHHTFPTG